MARLNEATKRLQAALESLEQVVESRTGDDGREAELRVALDSARQENAALQDAAGAVAARLDMTIERLKTTLEA